LAREPGIQVIDMMTLRNSGIITNADIVEGRVGRYMAAREAAATIGNYPTQLAEDARCVSMFNVALKLVQRHYKERFCA
jgi:hypothetical protein